MQKYFQKFLSVFYVSVTLVLIGHPLQATDYQPLSLNEEDGKDSFRNTSPTGSRVDNDDLVDVNLTSSNSLGLDKAEEFIDKIVKIYIEARPEEVGNLGYNPYKPCDNKHDRVLKQYLHQIHAIFLKDPNRKTNPIFAPDQTTSYNAYCQKLDEEFFRQDRKSFTIVSTVIGIPAGFFGASAACALFMKFPGDYFKVHASEERSLAAITLLTASTAPLMMEFLYDRIKSFMKGIEKIGSKDQTGYYFKRECSHNFAHAAVHLLSIVKALIIADVVYTMESPYGAWAPLFAGGIFLHQYASTAQSGIETTDELAQNSQTRIALIRSILLKKLGEVETQINSSDKNTKIIYEQLYLSQEGNYSRFARLFLPIKERTLTQASFNPKEAHLNDLAATFVDNLKGLQPPSRLRVFTGGVKDVIVVVGGVARIKFYTYGLEFVSSAYLAYPFSTALTLMQWYSERTTHQNHSDHLSDTISTWTTRLKRAPCRTMGSTLKSLAINAPPMVFPIVVGAALSTVVPAVGMNALNDVEPVTIKAALVAGSVLLDFSAYIGFLKRTARGTATNVLAGVMWGWDKSFGRCLWNCKKRREIHQKRSQIQQDITKARKALQFTINDDTIDVLSTLFKKEEDKE